MFIGLPNIAFATWWPDIILSASHELSALLF
jgi:hypothetical protein